MIACIAALLLDVFNEPVDDVDGAGDAVPVAAAIEGFLMIVTG